MTEPLRIGVPRHLLALTRDGGHERVWRRVLGELSAMATFVPLGRPRGRRQRRCDVVLCSGHEELPPAGLVPIVAQIHEAGWFTPELRDVLDPEFLAGIEPVTARAAASATAIIVPSRVAAADLVAGTGIAADRVHAVPHGVDPVFTPGGAGGAELVARAGGHRGTPYVLYAASLHPRKNLPALRAAMADLAGDGLPHQLVIVAGDAPDRADSTALARAALAPLPGSPGRVVGLPRLSDPELAAVMAGAAAFCLPSLYEGFGLTALEAMACGAPVIVSDRGALPEVVGAAGVVVAPTAAAVHEGLVSVLRDPELAGRLAAAGPDRARGFTWHAAAAGWLAVLELAARGAAAAP